MTLRKGKTMKKQIEELQHELEKWCMDYSTDLSLGEVLYKAGYRKQREGEWIVHTHHYECSNCGFEYETDVFAEDYNPITDFYLSFCSVCGAKMKGGA